MTPEDRKAMEKYLPLLEKVKAGLGDGKDGPLAWLG
jgi:hypothetical protein